MNCFLHCHQSHTAGAFGAKDRWVTIREHEDGVIRLGILGDLIEPLVPVRESAALRLREDLGNHGIRFSIRLNGSERNELARQRRCREAELGNLRRGSLQGLDEAGGGVLHLRPFATVDRR